MNGNRNGNENENIYEEKPKKKLGSIMTFKLMSCLHLAIDALQINQERN